MFVEEEDEFIQIAGGARLQISSPALEQHISQGEYQPAIRDPRLQLLDLSLQLRRLLLRVRGDYLRSIRLTAGLVSRQLLLGTFGSGGRGLTLGGVGFARAGIETGTFALRAERDTLIFCEAGLSLRSGRLDFPIGQVDPVRRQLRVGLRLLGGAHGGVRLFDRQRRAAPQVRIGLQLRQLAAHFSGAVRFQRCRRTGRKQHGRHSRGNQRPAQVHAAVVYRVHGLSPELRCNSSTNVSVLRVISWFTALALTSAVFAEASSASARDSSANRSAMIIRCSLTAVSADASLVRASLSSPGA